MAHGWSQGWKNFVLDRKNGRQVGHIVHVIHTRARIFSTQTHPDFFFSHLTFGMVITQLFWNETAFIYSYLLSAPTASQGPVFQLPIFQWKSQKHVELIPTIPETSSSPTQTISETSSTDNLRNMLIQSMTTLLQCCLSSIFQCQP